SCYCHADYAQETICQPHKAWAVKDRFAPNMDRLEHLKDTHLGRCPRDGDRTEGDPELIVWSGHIISSKGVSRCECNTHEHKREDQYPLEVLFYRPLIHHLNSLLPL